MTPTMAGENIPEMMLACQVVEFNKPYKIHSVPTPKVLGPHDLLVKTAVASYCHTDGMVQAGRFNTKLPTTASHEGAGTVVATGTEVKEFVPGDRVMCGIMYHACGECGECHGPEPSTQYCSNVEGYIGILMDGAFAEYVRVDGRWCAKLPDAVSFEKAAPLACAGGTIWRGLRQSGLKEGEWLAIVGSGGGLGHLGIQFAKALGMKVIGIDARDEGLELSRQVGADVVLDARVGDDSLIEAVMKATGGKGADATVNVTDVDSAAATACKVTKMHGLMVQIAQPENITIPFREIIFRDIRIIGSLICSPEDAKKMLEVVAKYDISIQTNAVHGIREIPKLLDMVHSGKMSGKGIVLVDEEPIKKADG